MAKEIVESCCKLSIFTLKSMGLLNGDWHHHQLIRWKSPYGGIVGIVRLNIKPLGKTGCIEITDTHRCTSQLYKFTHNLCLIISGI